MDENHPFSEGTKIFQKDTKTDGLDNVSRVKMSNILGCPSSFKNWLVNGL